MAKTKDKLLEKTGNARPYVERALTDEELRQNVRNAFESARDVYTELVGRREHQLLCRFQAGGDDGACRILFRTFRPE